MRHIAGWCVLDLDFNFLNFEGNTHIGFDIALLPFFSPDSVLVWLCARGMGWFGRSILDHGCDVSADRPLAP